MGRVLGIDYGAKRVGLALSDPSRIIASALSVITYSDKNVMLKEIVAVCVEHSIELIVVGMPVNMNGTLGPAAEKVTEFIKELSSKTTIPIETWDERLSTQSAEKALIESNTRREARKGLVDKVAAQFILQHYIDALAENALFEDFDI